MRTTDETSGASSATGGATGAVGSGGAARAAEDAGAARPRERGRGHRVAVAAWSLLVLGSVVALVAGLDLPRVPAVPAWVPEAGAAGVATAYAWALAARMGGRPVVFGLLSLVVGAGVVVLDAPVLSAGAAVSTVVLASVLGVVATVPAPGLVRATREATLALVVAAVGALAALGFGARADLDRLQYVALGLSLAGALGVVYRLGAGLHGLGRRGVVAALVGAALVLASVLYADLFARYGSPGLVDTAEAAVATVRDLLGAFPRPVEALVGVPALVWGCHMRARRRQGWWVCAFGTAATASTALTLLDPRSGLAEGALSVGYGLVVGVVLGVVLVRADLALTGTRGRRGRRAERGAALRPEPPRTAALL